MVLDNAHTTADGQGETANPARSALLERALAQELRPLASRPRRLLRLARKKPLGTFSVVVIIFLVLTAVFATAISPYDPTVGVTGQVMKPPSLEHPFGTDFAGRDLLSRVIYGAQVSLWVSLVSVCMGTFSGTILGILSGFFGGWFDIIVQRVIDAAMSIPLILMAVVIVSLVKPDLNNILIALSISFAPRAARLVRGVTMSVKNELYVEAAHSIGCPQWRIILVYILPNVFAPIIVVASVTMGAAIIAESSLNFLGLGSPTLISWGGMLSFEARQKMETAPWMAVFPGVAIMVTVLAFNLFGDAMRDVLDPRLRT